jgi:hypothetical protein
MLVLVQCLAILMLVLLPVLSILRSLDSTPCLPMDIRHNKAILQRVIPLSLNNTLAILLKAILVNLLLPDSTLLQVITACLMAILRINPCLVRPCLILANQLLLEVLVPLLVLEDLHLHLLLLIHSLR